MSEALSEFYSLIGDNHITHNSGYIFVGFTDSDGTLARSVENTNSFGDNTCYVANVFQDESTIHKDVQYKLYLKDFDDLTFKLSPEGEELAKEYG